MNKMQVQLVDLKQNFAEDLTKLANNPNIVKYLREGFPHPYKLDHAVGFIKRVNLNSDSHVKAILFEGEFTGVIGYHDIKDGKAELGYWLGEPYWGKGIISSAIPAIIQLAKNELELNTVYAYCLVNNPASFKGLERAGFQNIKTVDEDCNQIQKGVKSYYFELSLKEK